MESHLLQMRGLKLVLLMSRWLPMSHLLQMRGLKQKLLVYKIGFDHVASFTDAWIETGF